MKRFNFKKLIGYFYALTVLLLSALFFTNDFGLVDLRKSSVVIGVGLDVENDEIKLTAQLAVPQPAENGENTKFASVTGSGKTVACALNEVNGKTGFYPKLVFCKLIVLGESCFGRDVNTLLNYFFDNEYTGLTPMIAACSGTANKLLSLQLPLGDSTTDFIDRLLSEEAKKSGNVSSVNLNLFGQGYFTESGTAYMPYIESDVLSEEEEQGGQGGQEQSGGGQGGQSGQEQQGGSGGGSSSGGEKQGGLEATEFVCAKTATFTKGRFSGLLDKEQAFALNLIKYDISHAYTECGTDEERTVLGMRNCKGESELIIENGAPVLKLSFSASAKLLDDENDVEGKSVFSRTPEEVLRSGERTIAKQFSSLFDFSKQNGCDVLGVKDMLYKYHYKYYGVLKDVLYDRLSLVCDVKLKAAD